jgi:hypothetical protein
MSLAKESEAPDIQLHFAVYNPINLLLLILNRHTGKTMVEEKHIQTGIERLA